MKQIQLKQVPKGGLFRLSDSELAPLWVRESYSRSLKKYGVYSYYNVNVFRFRRGDLLVFVED